MSNKSNSVFDYLKPKSSGLQTQHPIFKDTTSYRPQTTLSSQQGFRKKYRNYGEEEDNENWLKQKSTIQNIPKKKRLVFRCSNGGNMNDEFASDNKIHHYESYQGNEYLNSNGLSKNNSITQSQTQFNKSQQNNFFPNSSPTTSLRNYNRPDSKGQQFLKPTYTNGFSRPTTSQKNGRRKYKTQEESVQDHISEAAEKFRHYRSIQQGENSISSRQQQKRYSESYNQDDYNTIKSNHSKSQQIAPKQQQSQQSLENCDDRSQQQQQSDNQLEDQQQQEEEQIDYRKILEKYVERGEIDPQWLDGLTQEEIQNLFTDDLIFDKNMDINKLLYEQPEYFAQLFETGSLKHKLVSGFQTTYGQDFYKKEGLKSQKTPALSAKVHTTKFGGQEQIGKSYRTMYKSDFIQHQDHKASQTAKKPWQPFGDRPNIATTSYGSNFVDWKDYNVQRFKSQKHVSTDSRIPFHGKTHYGENFGKNNRSRQEGLIAPNDLHKNKKAPFPMLSPFEQESTCMKNFKPFKIQANKTSKSTSRNYNPVPTFSGQFSTTHQRDFITFDPKQQKNQQKKQAIKQILKKLEKLREEKNLKEMEKLQKQIERYEREGRESSQYIK